MSNGKVKRWQAWVIADEVQRFQPVPEFFVSDEDHDRIVAELKAEVEYLKATRERLAQCELEALKRIEEKRQTITRQEKVIEVLKKEVVMAEERNNEIESAARESNMINIELKKDLAVRDTEIRKLIRETKEYLELAKEAGLANLKLQFVIQDLKDQKFYLYENNLTVKNKEKQNATLTEELIEPISGNSYKELYVYANAFAAELQDKNDELESLMYTFSRQEFVQKEIEEWKFSWMNVEGTDEEDKNNYFHRAFLIDANMVYDLAKRLSKIYTKEKE